jgi:hypothetical protein
MGGGLLTYSAQVPPRDAGTKEVADRIREFTEECKRMSHEKASRRSIDVAEVVA